MPKPIAAKQVEALLDEIRRNARLSPPLVYHRLIYELQRATLRAALRAIRDGGDVYELNLLLARIPKD